MGSRKVIAHQGCRAYASLEATLIGQEDRTLTKLVDVGIASRMVGTIADVRLPEETDNLTET